MVRIFHANRTQANVIRYSEVTLSLTLSLSRTLLTLDLLTVTLNLT